MTSGEIVPVAKAAAAVARVALGENHRAKDELAELAKNSEAMPAAAEVRARRIAVKQEILLNVYRPLAWIFRVRRDYFESGTFTADLAEKTAEIPEEHLTTPRASVAFPAMEGLGYSIDEPDLKEMYLNLLAAATDDRREEDAHPSFAEIIKQLSAQEAQLLLAILDSSPLPIIEARSSSTSQGPSRPRGGRLPRSPSERGRL